MFNKSKTTEKELTSQSNIISQSTEIQGNIMAQGNFRLEGRIKGNVNCVAKFVTSETSYIEGNVEATNAELSGEIVGDLHIKELLILRSSTKIKGNIVSNKLMIEPGATVDGNFKTNQTITSATEKEIKKAIDKI
jgi:cytoskeletal protein CcmA (bactofilin family)